MSEQIRIAFWHKTIVLGGMMCMAVPLIAIEFARAQSIRTPHRARPPKWDRVPPGIFFEDAFQEALRGDRPAALNGGNPPEATNSWPDHAEGGSDVSSPGSGWSKLISATSIEDEMKSIKRYVDEAVRTEGHFKGVAHKTLRPHLGTAAILWAIIDQFEDDVRWKSDAAAARDRFARVARNAKAGSSQVYREVVQRRNDLEDLIRGGELGGTSVSAALEWSEVADRQLIMQRLELIDQDVLAQGVASATRLKMNRERLIRECELAAAMAHVLVQEGMEDAGDSEYEEICNELRRAATEIRDSVERDDAAAARRAHGKLRNSCVHCHELYRA